MVDHNPDFNTLATTTLQSYEDGFEEFISTRSTVYQMLKQYNRIESATGRSIVVPLMYGDNSTSGTYDPYEDLAITAQDGMTAAEYTPKWHSVSVAISGPEKAMNSGPEQQIDLLAAKIKQAQLTAAEDFEDMFQSDGTGNSGKNFLGIQALIGDASSSVTTVGGIDASDSTNAYWTSQILRSAGTLTLKKLSHQYNLGVRGSKRPKWAQTTLDLYEAYEALLQPAQRFTNPKTAEAGFENLIHKGCTVVWGDSVESGTWTNINPDHITLKKWNGTWLKATPMERPVNRDAFYSQYLSYGQLVTDNRRDLGTKLEGLTA